MTRPSIVMRSPATPGGATTFVKFFSKMSKPACCGARPMCTYGPAVCDADSFRYTAWLTVLMSLPLHRRLGLHAILEPGCTRAAQHDVETVRQTVERDAGVAVEHGDQLPD